MNLFSRISVSIQFQKNVKVLLSVQVLAYSNKRFTFGSESFFSYKIKILGSVLGFAKTTNFYSFKFGFDLTSC